MTSLPATELNVALKANVSALMSPTALKSKVAPLLVPKQTQEQRAKSKRKTMTMTAAAGSNGYGIAWVEEDASIQFVHLSAEGETVCGPNLVGVAMLPGGSANRLSLAP